jgi:hypothetical protein
MSVAAWARASASVDIQPSGKETLLHGIADQAALHGVLAQIEALGLELLEVRRSKHMDI